MGAGTKIDTKLGDMFVTKKIFDARQPLPPSGQPPRSCRSWSDHGKEQAIKGIVINYTADRDIITAELAHYTKGHGRHVKDAVRIAIARLGWSTVFSLPGPTHEVKLALPVILRGLLEGIAPVDLVEAIAIPLRATLPRHHHH